MPGWMEGMNPLLRWTQGDGARASPWGWELGWSRVLPPQPWEEEAGVAKLPDALLLLLASIRFFLIFFFFGMSWNDLRCLPELEQNLQSPDFWLTSGSGVSPEASASQVAERGWFGPISPPGAPLASFLTPSKSASAGLEPGGFSAGGWEAKREKKKKKPQELFGDPLHHGQTGAWGRRRVRVPLVRGWSPHPEGAGLDLGHIPQLGPSCSFPGSPCLSFPQCREGLTPRASCSKTSCCPSGRDAAQGRSVKCLFWLIFLPPHRVEGAARRSQSPRVQNNPPSKSHVGPDMKLLPFILLFLLSFPALRAEERESKGSRKEGKNTWRHEPDAGA